MTRRRLEVSRTGLAGLAAWTVLLLVTLLNSAGQQVLDIKPEIYLAPDRMRWFWLSAWQPSPQLGFPNFNVGLAPVAWLVSGIQALGVDEQMSVRLLRLGLYTGGAWGAARLYRRLSRLGAAGDGRAGGDHHLGALVAAVVYVANPYAVVGGSTLAILLPYALLPWQSLCLVRALEEPRSWRWPAGFALAFAAMSGMNAGVVPLLQLVSVPVIVAVVHRAAGLSLRAAVLPLARCAVLITLVSLYWIVPSLYALAEGQAVLDNSETLEGISGPSSFAEVLRGLGLWPMYGSGAGGPWMPGFAPYLAQWLVVLLSFGFTAVVALSVAVTRGPVRRVAVGLVAVAAVIMVGLHPFTDPSPFGRVLRWGFEHSGLLGAFRTTNKAGAVLVLGAAMVVALAAATRPLRAGAAARISAGVAVAALLVGGAYPAFAGGLYPRTLDVPQYWRDAATAVDSGPADKRVWLVPGEVLADYRWTAPSPDDLALPLFSRPTVLRTTLPVASPYAANFLAAVDTQLQEGTLPAGALSTVARYLGVGSIVVRNDTVWEPYGARPWTIHQQVSADRGLEAGALFGAPGQNTAAPGIPFNPAEEGTLPPIQVYEVLQARPLVRAESLRGSVVVDGDGFAFAPMVGAGLLATQPTVRLAGDVDATSFAALLGPDHRLVLTDTNRRTDTVLGRLAGNQGPLLAASDQPASTRALFGTSDQTVLLVEGGATVTASMVGSSFGTLAEAAPENAFDGDPATSWQFGDFGTAVGQHLDVALDAPRTVDQITLSQATIGPVTADEVRIDFGGKHAVVHLPATGPLTVPLAATGDHFRITVQSTKGSGFNRVGISEIGLGGLRLTRIARMPDRIVQLASGLAPEQRSLLDATPLDVVLTRVRGTDGALDDAETAMQRNFALPDDRAFRVYGSVRPGTAVSEADYDLLAGLTGPVTASSSSHALGFPLFRASMAVDGDPSTAWVPSEPVVGESITVRFPRTTLDHVDVTQDPATGLPLAGWATTVGIALDGRTVTQAPAGPGTVRIPVPKTSAASLTLTVLGRNFAGKPVRISEIGIGGRSATFSPEVAARACVDVASVDGQPLRVHPLAPIVGFDAVPFDACPGQPAVNLGAGTHQLRSDGRWVADSLVLRDLKGGQLVAPGAVPTLEVATGEGSSLAVRASPAKDPWVLVTGQSHDPRWQASSGASSLGRPLVADGYSTGWLVPAGAATTIAVRYGPQRASNVALDLSLGTAAACLVLLGWPLLRQSRRELRPDEPAEGEPEPAPELAASAAPGSNPGSGPPTRHGGISPPAWLSRLAADAAVVFVAWFVADWVGAATAAGAVVALRAGVRPVRLTQAAVVLCLAVPLVWLFGNQGRMPLVTVGLVQEVPWAGRLAAAALVLLVVGALARRRPVSPPRPADADPDGDTGPGPEADPGADGLWKTAAP